MTNEQNQEHDGGLTAVVVGGGFTALVSSVVCVWVCLAIGPPDPNRMFGPFFYLIWQSCIGVLAGGLLGAVALFLASVLKSTDGWSRRRVAAASGVVVWCLLLIADVIALQIASRAGP
jgi:H+/Cl- antiporter ClcA